MENKSDTKQNDDKKQSEEAKKLEGLPIETSPYVQYKDLDDYKEQAYGTEGHLAPKAGHGAGGTDAPTPSGGASADSVTDTINSQGVP
ncbi:putative ribose/galactose/methyl galactoside import ATP-binding protein [Bienertia sinuspersici]